MSSEIRKKARGLGALTIYETLRDEILTLEMEPGQLVDETSIAKRFEVSRSPVREAFVRLTSEALLQTLPNNRSIVTPLRIEEFPQYIDTLDLIQRATTRLAAKVRTEAKLEHIKVEQQRFSDCVYADDVLGMIQSNRDFHVAIAKATNNRYMESAYAKLLDDGRRFLRLYFKSYGDILPKELINGHNIIVDAVAAQDLNLAEKYAHEHTLEVKERFLSYLGTLHMSNFTVEP